MFDSDNRFIINRDKQNNSSLESYANKKDKIDIEKYKKILASWSFGKIKIGKKRNQINLKKD